MLTYVIYMYYSYNFTLETFQDLMRSGLSSNDINLIHRWLVYQTNDPKFNITKKRSFGFAADELIIDSAFAYLPVDSNEFEWYYDYFYGNCFRYNLNQSKILELPESGLEMQLFAGLSDEYFNYLFPSYNTGLRLFISDRENIPISSEGILLKPGEHVNIQISKSLATILPKPYSYCKNFDAELNILTREMKRLEISYNRKDCLYICFQILTIDAFGCNDLQYPQLLDAQPCSNFTIFKQVKVLYGFHYMIHC